MTLQYHFLWASLSRLNHRGRFCITSTLREHVCVCACAHAHTRTHSGHAQLKGAFSSAVGSVGVRTIVLAYVQGKESWPSAAWVPVSETQPGLTAWSGR